jgi:hypothetical protein
VRRKLACLFVCPLLWFGCNREPAPAAKQQPVAPITVDARPASAPPDLLYANSPALAEPGNPLTVPNIEVSGEIRLPPQVPPPARVFIYASCGDCLDPSAPLLRRMPVTEHGAFLLHLTAEPGSLLSFCAAADSVGGAPVTLYGKAKSSLRVGPQQEQEVRELQIDLAVGEPLKFPAPPSKR